VTKACGVCAGKLDKATKMRVCADATWQAGTPIACPGPVMIG
jgi:hypothetical protein